LALPPVVCCAGAVLLSRLNATASADRWLLTKRSSKLKHHPGQLAFRAGKLDPGTPTASRSLREAWKRFGLR